MSDLMGQGKLLRRLEAIQKPRPLLRAIQILAVAESKKRVARKTGHTARTIMAGSISDTFAIVEAGGAARFLEYDTKPHKIRAKPGKKLAWATTAAGRRKSGAANARAKAGSLGLGAAGGGFGGVTIQLVGTTRKGGKRRAGGSNSGSMRFASEVNHPGTKAQPFLLSGAKEAVAKAGINPLVKAWNDAA